MSDAKHPVTHVRLTSHPSESDKNTPHVKWGEIDPQLRGPIIGTTTNPKLHNVIGTHAGSYAIYRALAVAAGQLDPSYVPDLNNTSPIVGFGPYPTWGQADKIVSLDPFGHLASLVFREQIAQGMDIRPSIAITNAHIKIPELEDAIDAKRLQPDGVFLTKSGEVLVTKIAVDPVWYLPGIAARFGCDETTLRYTIFENTSGMFPELITRPDLSVFLPPIGGTTVYCFGDLATLSDPNKQLTCRVHDECNGSDVFGSDICTCRPYLTYGIELCIQAAQQGGNGLIVYNRKEGRGLGEVTKFLVYNARKRQAGGDTAANYFIRTECVAGAQDVRFQELMPDVLSWLGISKIDKFVSMSNLKYEAILKQGIAIKQRIALPEDLIPLDAKVEMEAKKAAGYYSDMLGKDELENTKGRDV